MNNVYAPDRVEVLALVAAAVRAPSADNQHHLRFTVRPAGLTVRADESFVRAHQKHRRLLTLLSFGAVAENLRLKLTERGYTFEPAWFPDRSDPSLVLELDWADLTEIHEADPLAGFIESRHTNRRFFTGPPMSTPEAEALDCAVQAVPDVRLAWFDTSDRRRTLLRLIRIAETERFRSRALHAELFEAIAFEAGWTAGTEEHLAPATLEVERLLRTPFGWMRHWPVMRLANKLGAHRVLGLRAGDLPARLSPHLGVLASTLPTDEAAVAIGAAFQRLWLAADRAGLALQPMVASAILAVQLDSGEGASETICAHLNVGWRALVGDALPLIVFRLGRAHRPNFVSGRKPAESYLD